MLAGAKQSVRSGAKICVDRRALRKLLDLMEVACPDTEHAVFLEISESSEGEGGAEGVCLVRAASVVTGQHVVGYVRAIDTGGKWLQMDEWERKVCRRKVKRRVAP